MNQFQPENDALLEPTKECNDAEPEPKRNTKKSIIQKIKSLCQEHSLPLTESDTTLQRSSKTQLNKLLARKTEEFVEKKLKTSLKENAVHESDGMKQRMAVATLNYGLNTLNRLLDRGANMVLPRMGYELDHFMEKFEDPRTQQEVVAILKLIVAEHPEMLEHIASPYLRLTLVYVGCVSMSLRKIPTNKKHGTVRPAKPENIQSFRPSNGRKQTPREELSQQPSVQGAGVRL